ncbi:MAG: beta-propeller domain-containing protein [Myxococcota bacterium]
MRPSYVGILVSSAVLAAGAFAACGSPGSDAPPYQPDPEIGASSFVSAAVEVSNDRGDSAGPLTPGAVGQDGSPSERSVEEGDIYRALGGGLVLNLNPWRGLQVLDLNDPNSPEIAGSLRLAGQPVEAYVVGDHALVLMNGWQAYFGSASAPNFATASGGAVVVVDLSDPSLPVVSDHAYVGGDIRTSRLTTGGGQTALYVAAQDASWWYGGGPVAVDAVAGDAVAPATDSTLVRSFELVAGALEPRGELDLGGYVADIHATTEALLVARNDWTDNTSRVTVVDISDPGGALVEGADIAVAGQIASQFNTDLRGDVLRVVSGGRFNGSDTNHLETFDVSDIQAPVAIDHDTFGDGEQLYATIFLADRAFFVTYFVQDPFHAFAIDAAGHATETAEFVVSGWNDFFRPVLAESRLIGIGVDDAGGSRSVAVSLYDITDLANANPLVTRANVALESSWSGASWDHRAFSVLEDAASAVAPDGTPEKGLVLLPFNGWDETGYVAGVQVFTFSETTLTARGVMDHGSPVSRSFLADATTAANLSETTLALHDIADPNAPVAKGELSLAPSYDAVLVFGDYAARLEATTDYWWYYEAPGDLPQWQVQIVPLAEHPDTAKPVAVLPVTPGASLKRSGDNLVVVSTRFDEAATGESSGWVTAFEVWSLATPSAPALVGTFETDSLRPYYGGWDTPGYPGAALDQAYGYWQAAPNALVVGDALVFMEWRYETEAAGTREVCVTAGPGYTGDGKPGVDPEEPPRPTEPVDPADGGGGAAGDEPVEGETYTVGEVVCTSENGATPYCQGEIWECTWFETDCHQVDPGSITTTTVCRDEPLTRTWQRWVLHTLDLSDPTKPALAEPIEMPKEDQGVTAVVDGDTLYYSYRRPHVVEGDTRPFVKYFVRAIDLGTPSAPVVGAGVNVPGELLAAQGTTLFTHDHVYNDTMVESAVSRLTLSGDKATLMARKRFGERQVLAMLIDEAGRALVTHRAPWEGGSGSGTVGGTVGGTGVETGGSTGAVPSAGAAKADDATDQDTTTLSVLSADTLSQLSAVPVHPWATLRAALASRAVFQVPGGLLVMNLETPAKPFPQAWFATSAWPAELVPHGDTLLFAGGRYGVYRLDLTAFELFPLPAAAQTTP